jgi:hypothetical protein
MNISTEELLILLGSKEVELYLLRKRVLEFEKNSKDLESKIENLILSQEKKK